MLLPFRVSASWPRWCSVHLERRVKLEAHMSEQLLTTPQPSHRRKSPRSLSMREIIASYWDRSCWLPRRSPAGDPLRRLAPFRSLHESYCTQHLSEVLGAGTDFIGSMLETAVIFFWYASSFKEKHVQANHGSAGGTMMGECSALSAHFHWNWQEFRDSRIKIPLFFDGNTFRRSDHTWSWRIAVTSCASMGRSNI